MAVRLNIHAILSGVGQGATLRRPDREVLDACVARLEQLPLAVEASAPPPPWDARLRLRHDRQHFTYLVEVKRRLDRARLHHALLDLDGRAMPRRTRRLLVTDLFPDSLVDVLRDHDVDYVDAAGNMDLRFGPGLFVRVRGQRDVELASRRGALLTSLTSVRVLYALLLEPQPGSWTYRDLARLSGASLGAVASVMRVLRQRGHVTHGKSGYRLHRAPELLDLWISGYTEHFRPRSEVGRFRAAERDLEAVVNDLIRWAPSARVRWALTGTFAGYALTRHYRGEHLVLFMEPWSPGYLRELRWAPAAEGSITVLRTFSPRQLDHDVKVPDRAPGWPVAAPLLVYAELLADGSSRALETAGLIRERPLAHLLPAAPHETR